MIEYQIEGEGKKTVVFLHGWGGNKESFFYLSNQLKKEYTCVRIEWKTERKEQMGRSYSIFCYASELYMLLKHLTIDHVYLVGHSFGGRVAILLSSIFDIHVEGLVLLDSAGLKYHWSLIKYIKKAKYKFLKSLAKLGLYIKHKLKNYGCPDYRALSPTQKTSFNKVISSSLDRHLSHIDCPTLAIWGQKDKDTPLYFAKRCQRKIKNCEMIVYPNCSHFAYLERPYQTYLILKSFLGE